MDPPVHTIIPQFRFTAAAVLLLGIILMLLTAGCTSQAVPPVPPSTEPGSSVTAVPSLSPPASSSAKTKAVEAAAVKPDPEKIVISFLGGPDADLLMELETTVTDSRGTVRTRSMGSRLGTTPVQSGGSDTIYGPFRERAHVVIIGYFSDGTHQDLLDSWL
jgi:hypothetical protein